MKQWHSKYIYILFFSLLQTLFFSEDSDGIRTDGVCFDPSGISYLTHRPKTCSNIGRTHYTLLTQVVGQVFNISQSEER